MGRRIGRWLKWAHAEILPLSELLLFNASRAQLVSEVIQPSLGTGKAVICDRYTDSTVAYQSYGRGLDLATVAAVNNTAAQGLKPDLTILLDIPPEEGLARTRVRKQDRFEQEDIDFHQRVRQGYLELAAREPERWLVVDATQSKEEIAAIIWHRVSQLFSPGKK